MNRLQHSAAATIIALALTACPDRNYCADAPACEDNQAINCVTTCNQGPCSTGAHLRECGTSETCEVIPGNPQSVRFNSTRAVCVTGPETCNPATSGPPQCDGQGAITGCSGLGRRLTAPCANAAIYFERSACCTTGINEDAGTADGGVDGGSDAGP